MSTKVTKRRKAEKAHDHLCAGCGALTTGHRVLTGLSMTVPWCASCGVERLAGFSSGFLVGYTASALERRDAQT